MSVASHEIACGETPSVPVTVAGALLSARVCWGLADRRMSAWRIGWLVLCVQLGLHVAFAVSAAGGGPASASAQAHAHAGHGPGVDLLPGGPGMAVCHLTAALVLAGWLAVGERLLWRVARTAATAARNVARRLRRRQALALPVPVAPFPPVRRRERPPRTVAYLSHVVVRRGPPAVASA